MAAFSDLLEHVKQTESKMALLETDWEKAGEQITELVNNRDILTERYATRTPLMVACCKKADDVAFGLIEKYGKECLPEYVDGQDLTVLYMACVVGSNKVALKLMETFGATCLPPCFGTKYALSEAYLTCDKEVAIRLIELYDPADPPQLASTYGSLLITMIKKNNEAMARRLLEKFGAQCQIGKIDHLDMTAWEYAKQNKMTSIMELLKTLS